MTTALQLGELIPEQLIPPADCQKMIEEVSDVVDRATDDEGHVDPFFKPVSVNEGEVEYTISIELPRDQVRSADQVFQVC